MKTISFFLLLFCLTIPVTKASDGDGKRNKRVNRVRAARNRAAIWHTLTFRQSYYNRFQSSN